MTQLCTRMLTPKRTTQRKGYPGVTPLTLGVAVVVGAAFLKTYCVPGTRQDDLHTLSYLRLTIILQSRWYYVPS